MILNVSSTLSQHFLNVSSTFPQRFLNFSSNFFHAIVDRVSPDTRFTGTLCPNFTQTHHNTSVTSTYSPTPLSSHSNNTYLISVKVEEKLRKRWGNVEETLRKRWGCVENHLNVENHQYVEYHQNIDHTCHLSPFEFTLSNSLPSSPPYWISLLSPYPPNVFRVTRVLSSTWSSVICPHSNSPSHIHFLPHRYIEFLFSLPIHPMYSE